MAMTRANVEFVLVAEHSPLLVAADMAVTVVGTNADLNGPIGRAVNDMGYTVVSPILIADADVANIADAERYEFLAIASLHTLEAVLSHLDNVDITVGPRSEKLSQLAAQVERKIKRLKDSLEDTYGYGMPVPVQGTITLNFAEHA